MKPIKSLVAGSAAFCFLVIMGSSVSAQAPTQRSFELNAFATYWDVKDGDDNVWGPGIGTAFYFTNEVALDFRMSYFADVGEDNFGDMEVLPFDLGLSYHFAPNREWDVSVLGGASYAMVDFSPNVDGIADVDNNWGAYAGVGGTYFFAENLGFFTNVYYRFMEFDGDIDDRVFFAGSKTLEADGLNVDMGLKYLF